jgi:tetratricopeptide (TPR) repeat protein
MFGMGDVAYPDVDGVRARPVERLDGWKCIAAYLKRDRTTVIRWTRERGLPVHRLPGGRTGTVFALKHELDRWAGMPDLPGEAAPSAAPATFEPAHPAPARPERPQPAARRWLMGFVLAGFAVGMPAVLARQSSAPPRPATLSAPVALALPQNPATAAKFLTARDLVAERKAAGLERAIVLLAEVVHEAPGYALGHATLAQALVLSREFGMRSDADAFAQARIAATTANRLAPRMASGHRMLGFIAYWADRDFPEADAHFRRALALDPNDAYTHFWYGNILSDHGNHAAGLKALDQARLLLPGSVAIATDLAWAQWSAGQDAVAKAALAEIVQDHPDFAIAYDCLANIALAEGDYAGYARNFARYAELKQNARLIEDARAVNEAIRESTAAGHREILRQALAAAAEDPRRNLAWPALVASVGRDRTQLLAILDDSRRHGARWGDAGIRLRLQLAWQNDPEVYARLSRLSPSGEKQA